MNEGAGGRGDGNDRGNYWDSLAHHYRFQRPPLRASAEDAKLVHKIVCEWGSRHPKAETRAVLLGVTPELADLPWPANTHLLAVDKSRTMIDAIWLGDIPGRREVIEEDWLSAGIAAALTDFVVGDGFLTAFAFPEQYALLAEVVSRWLKPDGLMIARLFLRRERKETLEDIVADLRGNRVTRFDALRWRLAMLLQDNAEDGVRLDGIYRAWRRIEEMFPGLAERCAWPAANVETIELYQGRQERYTFPTVEETHRAFAPHLEPVSVIFPQYELGERCPILSYRPSCRLAR